MKRSAVWVLLSYSVLGLTGIPVRAQATRSEGKTLVVEPGNDFRAALEKGVRLKAPGQPITARLVEPVYAGEVLAIPAGSTIKGHVSAISTAPMRKRAGRLLNGDFTPPKTAHVTFDQLVLSDGTTVPIHSDSAVGLGRVANSQYLPKAERPGIGQKLKGATAPLREPHKLQRLGEAVVTSLPYHPEYIDQGTVFDTALVAPVTVLVPVQPNTASPQASEYVHGGHADRGRCFAAVLPGGSSTALSRRDQNRRDGPESLLRGVDEEKRKHGVCLPLSPDAGRHDQRYPFNGRRHSSRAFGRFGRR